MCEQVRKAFTDGAARGNPGPGGWGAVVAYENSVTEYGGSEAQTTNNKMELVAAIEAIKNIPRGGDAEIVTDSAYLVNGATAWIHTWKNNNWKTRSKAPVKNIDLWQTLDELLSTRNVKWKRVSGHSGIPGNERANDIAEHFADNKPIELYEGSLEKYSVDLSHTREDAKQAERKQRSRSQAYSYVSLLGGKIETHKTWEECKRRVHGTPARYKKALSRVDEERIIKEWKPRA